MVDHMRGSLCPGTVGSSACRTQLTKQDMLEQLGHLIVTAPFCFLVSSKKEVKPRVPLFDLRAGANLKHFCNVVVRCRAKLGTHLRTHKGA